jgi:hypothetical protein
MGQVQAMHEAARDGELGQVQQLLEGDPRLLNGRKNVGMTPLMSAAQYGRDVVVEYLLDRGADMGLRGGLRWYSAQHWACVNDHSSTMALLLDRGAVLEAQESSLLMVAARFGAVDCVARLRARGGGDFDVDKIDSDPHRFTALHHAARAGHVAVVRLLLTAGADIAKGDWGGYTPLDAARLEGHEDCISLLETAERHHALLKARTLTDAAQAITNARASAEGEGAPPAMQRQRAMTAAPACLKWRAREGWKLPAVKAKDPAKRTREDSKRDAAVMRYVLGLEGGGNGTGLVDELFVELREMLLVLK